MKKSYSPPTILEYGPMKDITRGATGSQPDYIFVNGQLINNNNSPTCTSNVVSGACVTTP
ncbi:MAG: hypothetical protein M1296_06440 [Chloroflexi bacterium]|nr:hypothetical protein [Chloroflexota bacterium]